VDPSDPTESVEAIDERPLDTLSIARAQAQKNFATQLENRYRFAPDESMGWARAVVDPSAARAQLDFPLKRRFTGGEALLLPVQVWGPAILPGLINPRVSDERVYPASVIGTGGPEPLMPLRPAQRASDVAVLDLFAESEDHVRRIIAQSEQHLRQNVQLRDEIAADGVNEFIMLVATHVHHSDGRPPVFVPMAVDGSTRATFAHLLSGFESADVLYHFPQLGVRAWRELLQPIIDVQSASGDEVTEDELRRHRTLTLPAYILLDVRPDRGRPRVSLLDAIRAVIGAIHVKRPEDWTERVKFGEIADAALERVAAAGAFPLEGDMHRYLGGYLRPTEMSALGFDPAPDVRAAHIAAITLGPNYRRAVNKGLHTLLTQRITEKERAKAAAQLILRSFAASPDARRDDGIRSVLERALELKELSTIRWMATPDSPEVLLDQALLDLETSSIITAAQLQLGIQGLAYLATSTVPPEALPGWTPEASGRAKPESPFRRDRNTDDDLRAPSVIFRALLRSEWGLRQLHRAVVAGRAGASIPLVKPNGADDIDARGETCYLHNTVLRHRATREVPETAVTQTGNVPAGLRTQSSVPPDRTVREIASRATAEALRLAGSLEGAMRQIDGLRTADGQLYALAEGVSSPYANEIASKLRNVANRFELWGAAYDQISRTAAESRAAERPDEVNSGFAVISGDEIEPALDSNAEVSSL
jgi:hypothetical protein